MLATEIAVKTIATPAATETWRPIGHRRFIEMVDAELEVQDIPVRRRTWHLFDEGNQFRAVYHMAGIFEDIPGSLGFALSLQGSINKTLSQSLGFMTQVLICSNGMTAAEHHCKRKNTTNIVVDIAERIREGLKNFTVFREIQTMQYERLVETAMTDADVHDFICRVLLASRKTEAITANHAVKVLDEWHEPTHNFDGNSAWRLHNAFTEVAKLTEEKNPTLNAVRNLRLNRLFVNEFASDLPTIEQVRTGQRTISEQQQRWGSLADSRN
jgi:hypothetical protein